MSHFRFIMILLIAFSLSITSFAEEHRLGITGGASMLYGDLDKVSDPGPSVRAAYEMIFNPIFSAGIEAGVQQVEGKTWILDRSSKYFGVHPYKTTILPGGLFAKVRFPGKFAQPYIEGGAGLALWIPEEVDKTYFIPMDKEILWSVDPYASIGGGIVVDLTEKLAVDIGARSRYFFSDNLDNINGGHLTGSSNFNDYTVQGGISLIYKFGGKKETAVIATESVPEVVQEKAVPVSDRDNDGIPDSVDASPDEPEDFDGFEDSDGRPDPDNDNDGIPDIRDGAPIDAEDFDNFEDEDGIPDLDNDGDGIADSDDPFPNIPLAQETSYDDLPYSIHVSSYRSLNGADEDVLEFISRGYNSFRILHSIPDIGNMYRVYVGHFKTKSEADVVAAELLRREFTEYAKVVMPEAEESPQATQQNIKYFIHVSSFRNEQNAQIDCRSYELAGFMAKTQRVDLEEKGIWFRVYLGPYSSRAEALDAVNYIKEAELSDYTAIISE